MPTQEVGVRAVFDTQQFNQGLKRYIKGLGDAVRATQFTVAGFNNLATAFSAAFTGNTQQVNGVTQALQQMASAARQATRATRQAGGAAQASTGLERDLEIQRLIKNEIKDRISEEKQLAVIRSAGASSLARSAAQAEREMINIFRQMRDQQLTGLQLPPDFFESIRNADAQLQDLGNSVKNQARDLAADYRLLSEEVRDRVRSEQIIQTLQNTRLSQLERERNLLELQQIALAQIARTRAAQNANDPSLLSRLAKIQTAPVEQQDLGTGSPLLERELAINKLITEALRDRITLARTVETLQDKTATAIQRQQAGLQQANLLLERQRRLAEFIRLGGDPKRLDQANKAAVTAADLNKRANDDLLRQVEIQNLLQEEVRARIELEKVSVVLADRKATTLQREAALLQLQTLELQRQLRTRAAQQAGVPMANVQAIRNAAVATRDLGTEQTRTATTTESLTVRTVALGSALGTLAANAITRIASSLGTMGGQVLENVRFFERLELSVGFYTARSVGAAAASLNYKEKIALVADETEGLLVWLQRLAVASPFTTKDVGTLFRTSQAYGLLRKEAEVLTPLLLDFAAAAGLDEDILERLALAIGQVRARGKLTGEEIRQLGNSGIPIRDILVKTLGIANEEFDELVESGALTSDIVIPAIVKALKEFEGAGEAVAYGTIGGIVSAFEELRQIGSAKFFRAALEPLKQSFQDFFQLANDPSVLAMITVLGEEVGIKLAGAFNAAGLSVRGAIASFNALDPAIKQQIVVFGGLIVVAIAGAAAFGLMTTAITFLTQPVVGLTILVAFLISEWTSGFAVLRSVTGSAVRFIGGMLSELVTFGIEAVKSFAEGMVSGSSVVADAMGVIGSVIAFFMAPGSPPRIAPDIDKWGQAAAQEYLNAFAEANPETPMNKLGEVVERGMVDATIKASKAALQKFQELNPEVTLNMARELNASTREAYGVVVDAIPEVLGGAEATGAAEEAGFRVSEAYINGFGHLIRKLQPAIDPELQNALFELGSGRQLSNAGAGAFNQYLEGFKNSDFSILEEASGVVEDFLKNMVDQGELSEGDMVAQLFGTRADLAKAIQEFRKTGKISEATLDAVAASSWDAGDSVRDLLVAYQEAATADDQVADAQKRLNEITKQYTAQLKPLRAELERISGLRQTSDEDEQIRDLRRLIANEAVSASRKENAQYQIAEILQKRRVDSLEKQQTAQTELAQTELDAATERQTEASTELDLVKARINSQLQQLGLVSEEAQLMKRLAEEVEKLREKQKSGIELQAEMIKLQQAELGDLEKAAKAKYVLDQADSTELERQNAILDLQEVALGRQQRLVEARKLGIPEEELTKLYNFQVTLDDIGVKTKDDFSALGGNLDEIIAGTVNAKDEAAKWKEELRLAREKVDEIKISLGNMFGEIDKNLPSWLKIFPEKEGERPPILDTLDAYKWAILGVGTAIVISKILGGLASMLSFFRLIGGVGGAAAAGGATGGAAGLAAAAIRSVGSAIGWAGAVTWSWIAPFSLFAETLLVVYAAAWAVGKAFEFLEKHAFGRTMIDSAKGPMGDTTFDPEGKPSEMFGGPVFTNPFADAAPREEDIAAYRENLKGIVAVAVNEGVASGLAETDIQAQVAAALSEGIASGMLPEDPVLIGAATDYMNALIAAYKAAGEIESPSKLSGREVGVPFGQGIIDGVLQVLAGEGQKGGRIGSAVTGMLALVTTMGGALETSLTTTMGNLRTKLNTTFASIYSVLTTKAADTRRDVKVEFLGLASEWKLSTSLLQIALATAYLGIKTDSVDNTTQMRVQVTSQFGTLKTTVTTQADLMKLAVVAAFQNMKLGVDTEVKALQKLVTDVFVGQEGQPGLVDLIESTLMGQDGLRPFSLGANYMIGIADGITSEKQTLADALVGGLQYALLAAQQDLEIHSPSGLASREVGEPVGEGTAQGVFKGLKQMFGGLETGIRKAFMEPVEARFGSRPSVSYAGGASNITNIRHYNLTVQSAASSQGVINDFGIMQTMAAGT